jgi:hypothetical protein
MEEAEKLPVGSTAQADVTGGERESAQRREIQLLLDLLFSHSNNDGLVFGLCTESTRRGHWFTGNETQRAAGWALAMSRLDDVFVRPMLVRGPRTDTYDPQVVTAGAIGLWLNLSLSDAPERAGVQAPLEDSITTILASRFPLRPTVVAGDGGTLVLGWLFNRPWIFNTDEERERGDRLQQRFVFTMRAHAAAAGMAGECIGDGSGRILLAGMPARSLGGDSGRVVAGNAARVLAQSDCRYEPDDFRPHLAEEVTVAEQRSAAILGDEVVRLEPESPEPAEPHENVSATFSNIASVEPERAEGHDRVSRKALAIDEIVRRILDATGGWPRRVGRRLFVASKGGISWLDDATALFAWLQSKGQVRWAVGSDDGDTNLVTRAELDAYLRMNAHPCSAIGLYPWEPAVADAWQGWRSPRGYAPTGAFLSRLLVRFCPATPMDASLLRAMLLTFVWGGSPGQRPLFVVTGDRPEARGIGRTQCLRLLAEVVGGALEVSAAEPGTIRNLETRLASPSGLQRRVVVVDEFPGVLLPQALARWVDAGAFEDPCEDGSFLPRPNLVTWCVAARDPSDVSGGGLADRAVVIRLAVPNRDAEPNWEAEVRAFIREHRDRILADASAILRGNKSGISLPRTRFTSWCEEVLAADPQVNEILRYLGTRDLHRA